MSVDAATVKRVAHLARIKIDDDRAEVMAGELSNILDWVEQLGEVDTAGVEPLSAVIPNVLRWREDGVTDGNIQDKVLANAPKSEDGFLSCRRSSIVDIWRSGRSASRCTGAVSHGRRSNHVRRRLPSPIVGPCRAACCREPRKHGSWPEWRS
ncbi:MAG: Asp-tRNA(Asn)/Glu-tRNA(Gln) amidotransferase subunit GatC [Sphingomonadales bacterium]|nr:Asp-tRNA(Asn)/Glu-tRNA(Gln) amidotransferase subunit GatC [Sphingomonadales bacterium]